MAFQRITLTPEQQAQAINLYRNNMGDDDVAEFLGMHLKSYRAWLKRREQAEFRQRVKQAQIQTVAMVRQALLTKAIGTTYKAGRPAVIQDGKVVDQGETSQAAIPGNLNAMQYWLQNCDVKKIWRNIREHALTNSPKTNQLETESMSDSELVEIIMKGIQDGVIPMSRLKMLPEETRSSLPPDQAVDATFTEDSGQ